MSATELKGDRKPNVLFIAVDDLRPSLGCYGDKHAFSPNIDALAKRSVLFDQAHCQVAVCNPSRASLMTGLRPDKLGVWTLPIHFREARPDAVTIPQWFRRHGYTAISHGKIFHNPTPDPQSWSEPIRQLTGVKQGYPDDVLNVISSAQTDLPPNDWRKNNLRGPATAAPVIADHLLVDGARTDLVIEDLARFAESEQPFFLAMGFIRPHLAWIAPKKYWDMYDPSTLPVLINEQVIPNTPPYAISTSYELTHYVDQINFPKPRDAHRLSNQNAQHLMHGYYACVSYVDAQIGRILAALEEHGHADNTIVVLWSDHGWKLGEHNGWGKMSNYEIDTRVPLLIATPDSRSAGQRISSPVELLDLFPTLCDLTEIERPTFIDGKSRVDMLYNPKGNYQSVAYSQYYRRHDHSEDAQQSQLTQTPHVKQYMGYALRTATHRYVQWRDFETGATTAHELYDHRTSDGETENIFDKAAPELINKLSTTLLKSHPPKKLSLLPAVHSNPNTGRLPSPLTINNNTSTDLFVYPISTQGRRGRRSVVAPKETLSLAARIGGVFVIESRDGTVHEIHSPSFPAKTIVISAAAH
ncbi:MAG: sulfatase [Planctomycetaceae bacterium]|nr:sulfatase [Planctomycetaceae bacterium]